MKNRLFCAIAGVFLATVGSAGELKPFEYAGIKLGAYASDYDVEGEPGNRKLDQQTWGFDKMAIRELNNRVVEMRLSVEPRIYDPAERNKHFDGFAKGVRAKLRNCKWKNLDPARWQFTSHDETVVGSLCSYGDMSKIRYEFRASITDGTGGQITYTVNAEGRTVATYGDAKMRGYLNAVKPFEEPKTTEITNMFGVTLGMKLEDVGLKTVKLKTRNSDVWNYGFTPKKKFRRFDVYKLKVEKGIVMGIQATVTPGEYAGDIVAVVDILRKKYQAAFAWPSTSSDTRIARHVGYGDDYTILEIEHKSVRRTLSVEHSMSLTLSLDAHRRELDRVYSSRRKHEQFIKSKPDPHKYDGIDAL